MDAVIEHKPIIPEINLQQQIRGQNVFGLFRTVSSAPTGVPNTSLDQIQFLKSGSTLQLYFYDATNHAWHFATMT
jgi:hypothetical protein